MVRNGQILNIVKAEQFLALDTDYEKKGESYETLFFSTENLEEWGLHQLRWRDSEAGLGKDQKFSLGHSIFVAYMYTILYYNYILYICHIYMGAQDMWHR